jgi:hypothetical protein
MIYNQKNIVKILKISALTSPLVLGFSKTFTNDITLLRVTTDATKETINGRDFVALKENKNGILTERWQIDCKEVSYNDYKVAIANATADMIKEKLEKDRQTTIEKAEQMKQLKQKAAKRLVEVAYEKIRNEIKQIQEYGLEQNLMWNQDTISSQEEYNQIVKESSRTIEIDRLENVQTYAKHLENIAARINRLFFKTVEYVVAHTTDTKLLKRLMELL